MSAMAKSYRLLHAIFATAAEDGLVPRNPCIIKGASIERPAERPVASIAQVCEIADAIEPHYRAMVMLVTFCRFRSTSFGQQVVDRWAVSWLWGQPSRGDLHHMAISPLRTLRTVTYHVPLRTSWSEGPENQHVVDRITRA